jgi:ubiquinone/menaquinone biosynthesis C-methylase UbiE
VVYKQKSLKSETKESMSDMSTPSKPEKPSTYFVQDRSNQDEMHRLQGQDQLLTTGMGGVLPEQPDLTRFRTILDVGCGTGGWLIEVAKTIPTCTRLVGVDVSRTFTDYARAQAEAAGVSDRVEFRTMDALLMLNFPDHSFDLVNHRLASGWIRTWEWPKLLSEYRRVSRRDGIVRITEPEVAWESNSPALSRIVELYIQAFYQAGHLFTPTANGVNGELARLLSLHGLLEVQTRSCAIEYRAGTPGGQRMFEDARVVYRTALPFLRKWMRVPEDYEQTYQQMLVEMQQPDFVETWNVLTAWGKA